MICILTSVGIWREKNETTAYWHAELLGGYWRVETDKPEILVFGDTADTEEETLLGFDTRHGGLYQTMATSTNNLARHLVGADRSVELGALLLDARWTHLRMRVGGYRCT